MKCNHCNAENPENAKICKECGEEIKVQTNKENKERTNNNNNNKKNKSKNKNKNKNNEAVKTKEAPKTVEKTEAEEAPKTVEKPKTQEAPKTEKPMIKVEPVRAEKTTRTPAETQKKSKTPLIIAAVVLVLAGFMFFTMNQGASESAEAPTQAEETVEETTEEEVTDEETVEEEATTEEETAEEEVSDEEAETEEIVDPFEDLEITPLDKSVILQEGLPEAGEEIAIVKTSMGDIKLRFYPEEAPLAVENFKELAKSGYYDGIIFHRVIDNFMIQGGDPTGTGSGGESFFGGKFEDEISPNLHFFRGALAMANAGPNTNGSQFFIVQNPLVDTYAVDSIRMAIEEANGEVFPIIIDDEIFELAEMFPDNILDYYVEQGGYMGLEFVFGGQYTIFGQAFEGLDIVDAIAKVETNSSDKPLEDIVIESIEFVNY
ncbi:MAG: peptidylprolyl isomerase [Bacillota bacterium]